MTRDEVKRWQRKEPALDIRILPPANSPELAERIRAEYVGPGEPSIRRLAIRYSLNINTVRRMIRREGCYAEKRGGRDGE